MFSLQMHYFRHQQLRHVLFREDGSSFRHSGRSAVSSLAPSTIVLGSAFSRVTGVLPDDGKHTTPRVQWSYHALCVPDPLQRGVNDSRSARKRLLALASRNDLSAPGNGLQSFPTGKMTVINSFSASNLANSTVTLEIKGSKFIRILGHGKPTVKSHTLPRHIRKHQELALKPVPSHLVQSMTS